MRDFIVENSEVPKMRYIKLIILVISACFVLSCSNGSTTTATNNSTQNDKDIPPPVRGNGIIDYSVATDYYYGIQNQAPSLKVDLHNHPNSNIQYVFADFISLNSNGVNNAESSTITGSINVNTQCPTDKTAYVINYYAMPQVAATLYQGVLGNCTPGTTITSYYSSITSNGGPLTVVPWADYGGVGSGGFPQAIAYADDNIVKAVAESIAAQIMSDHNAYGLAVDNELAINSFNGTIGAAKEQLFFGTIAANLVTKNTVKYLFLFDANSSAESLYANGQKNIIILYPLYDFGEAGSANPDTLATYVPQANRSATGYMSFTNYPPVIFVVPASGTATLWNSEEAYNYPLPISHPTYANPITGAPITPTACESLPATESGSIDNVVLTNLILSPGSIVDFISTSNCYNFVNPQPITLFFESSLAAISTARASESNLTPYYLGTTLYAWRIYGYNDINGVKSYYSLYTQGSDPSNWVGLKPSYQVFPANIEESTWTIFDNWNNNP